MPSRSRRTPGTSPDSIRAASAPRALAIDGHGLSLEDIEPWIPAGVVPAGAVLRYTQGGVPDNNTSLTAGETNGALFYNVTPGPVTVTAESPYCKPIPFPVKADGVTYTGKLTTEPGSSFSFIRIFLGPPAPAGDAGADASFDASSDAGNAGDATTD